MPDTLVLQAIRNADGQGVVYDYFYDAQKKHYTLIEKLPGGRMVESVINLNGETVERYENGKLMTKTVIDGNRRITTNELGQKTIREYDTFKNLIRVTWPDETTERWQYNVQNDVTYSDHDNGDLKHYTDPEGRTLEYYYDANRQLESITLPNVGLYTVNSHRWFAPEQVTLPGGTVQKRSYDGFMQLTGIEVKDPAQNTQMNYQYQHDRVGNITVKQTEHGAYRYNYDNLYRLLEAENPNSETETFTYDPVGNRLTSHHSPTPWEYNANQALQSRPDNINYSYDINGATIEIDIAGQTPI